ncbi:exodeoxyribonuclease VII large subunit [Gilliamella sp. wkB108]|uniref:exodeoxyribonuclease VII large subunit n=1 Tax=Gilliamella sp. wkB108 TaxID=3120256 RepID=UPI00080EA0B4|nr:exodeoxyribonuclease VII large subunit [Gilliamella apicola]OCG21111.1 exodeoxyribonuclease VII large subunit [Gilliamella apicola]
MQGNKILSVKDLNQMVKDLLTDAIGQIWLVGEISNFSRPSSGHWYFTLKDDTAQVRCAMFRNSNFRVGFTPQNGQQVLVRASVTLYEARGEYQLVIDKMQAAGAGLLQQKFEQLKQKLSEEGLFDAVYKKTLPDNIRTVGIITSSTGAALHDICQILKRRDPSLHLIIYPTQVQGNEAAAQIAKMIQIANLRQECDVLIVGRGGGSLEDLWSFNEEVVARAIFASQLPIVSAVGHEIDFTIADFVADVRAPTPSAAAELVSRDKLDQIRRIEEQNQRLSLAMDYYLMRRREMLNKLRHQLQTQHPQAKLSKQLNRLLTTRHSLYENIQQYLLRQSNRHNSLDKRLSRVSPQNNIIYLTQKLSQKQQQMFNLIQQKLVKSKHQFAMQTAQLNSVSPLATLERGYTVTTNQAQTVIRSREQVTVGEVIITRLKNGKLVSQVVEIE